MKLKKLTGKQGLAIMVSVLLVTGAFLIATQSYFHTKEIKMASEGCYDIDGDVVLETSFLNLSYSFSCEAQ